MTTLPDVIVLPPTGAERCDRCSAAAQVRAVLPAGDLLFCGHHARAYRTRLLDIGAALSPERTGLASPW
jgi:hypothetical protein